MEVTPDLFQKMVSEVRVLQSLVIVMLLALVILCLVPRSTVVGQSEPSILRTRGVVIEDEDGHARIVLGAPIKNLKGRVRQEEVFGAVFLTETGIDELVIGDVPNPQVLGKLVKRVGRSTGIVVNDQLGNERGGFSFFPESDKAVIGLDYPGREAISLVATVNGNTGLIINGAPGRGAYDQVGVGLNNQSGFTFFKVANTRGSEQLMMTVDGGKPRVMLTDATGSLRDVTTKLR